MHYSHLLSFINQANTMTDIQRAIISSQFTGAENVTRLTEVGGAGEEQATIGM